MNENVGLMDKWMLSGRRERKKSYDLFHKILKREIYLSCTSPKYACIKSLGEENNFS